MQIPQYLKKVFDTFPLKTYAAVPEGTSRHFAELDSRKHYFAPSPAAGDATTSSTSATAAAAKTSTFILGVNNVVEYEQRVLPSDPISLAQCLIMCHKNGLKLPQVAAESSSADKQSAAAGPPPATPANCIMSFSHLAAPDNQLPIIIEDSGAVASATPGSALGGTLGNTPGNTPGSSAGPQRTIISSTEIANSHRKSLTSATGLLVNDLVETKLYDVWISCLLVDPEVDAATIAKLFTLNIEGGGGDSPLLSMYSLALLQDVPSWRAYSARHGSLFHTSRARAIVSAAKSVATTGGVSAEMDGVRALYAEQLAQLETSLRLLESHVSDSSASPVLKWKLIAFLVSVDQTLSATRLGQIVASSSYLQTAYTAITDAF